MLILALALLLVAISLGAAGQVLLKAGLRQLGEKPAPLVVLRSIVTNLRVFSGFGCYGLSSLLYIVALSRLDLSYAYPMVALSYVMVAVLAWWLLDETVPPLRVVGLGLVLLGVVVVALSHRREPPEQVSPPAIHGDAPQP